MRDNIEKILSLTPMQEGMLFHTLASNEEGMYVQQLVLRVKGELDVPRFEKAWARVVSRHQALRSAFVWESAEKPLQVVFRDVALASRTEDWRAEPEEVRRQRWQELVARDRTTGFTLRRPPLFRLTFVRLGDQDHGFVFTYHHILLDGWSGSIVFKDVLALYEALGRGVELELPPAVGMDRYAEWAKGQKAGDPEAFFRRHLAGLRAPTPLYEDLRAQRTAAAGTGFEARERFLSEAVTARLHEFARAHRITMSTVLQGAWAAMLSRHSGESEVLFGAISSGRPADLAGVDRMVGLFVNTLPARVRIDRDDRVVPWLLRLQRDMAEVRQFEHVSLVNIHPWSEIPAGRPLFETCQVWENVAMDVMRPFTVGDVTFTMEQYSAMVSDPMTFFAFPGAQLKLQLVVDRSRVSPSTAERLLGHAEAWLAALPDGAERRVSELALLTPVEKKQLFEEWMGATRPLPARGIHELIEEQARRTPDARAVEDGETSYTYRELDERANRIAQVLRSMGVVRGTRVGLSVRRCADMVAAVLGVMKANGAYVPLDPAYPRARLEFMARDAELTALITQEGSLEQLPLPEERVLFLDRDAARLAAAPPAPPKDEGQPEDVCYVLYTSGSTGVPKGVQVVRRAVLNLLRWSLDAPLVTPSDVMLAVTSLSFDIAEVEILSPLLVGARLVVVPQAAAADAAALREWLARSGATVMQGTPATWRMMLAAKWEPTPGLRVLTAGEALSPDLARQICAAGNEGWNLYGPTETTIYSTAWKIDPRAPETSIGRPVDNTQVYVVDAGGQVLPAGVVGELVIGGTGMARGYLNRPELTAERFVQLPATGPELVYRTGDLVRWREDGTLDYLGRRDHQVKVRGNRVELGEIETALTAEPTVRQAAVTVVEDAAGEQSLVGYVVADTSGALDQVASELGGEHVDDWQRAWDDAYDPAAAGSREGASSEPTFDTRGWNSSFDGRPIPREQMREWLDGTLSRIRALDPSRVLEIGCGTGMILFGLAAECERYVGSDFSRKGLAKIAAQLPVLGADAQRVVLIESEAGDLHQIPDGSVDTVVINSVAQYFPSVAKLRAVLERAIQKLAPRGRIFLGDVRDLGLHAAFWTDVHLHGAAPGTTGKALRELVERSLATEKELLVQRSFFTALPGRMGRVASARCLVKRGRGGTEMERYRYDVILQLDESEELEVAHAEDWGAAGMDLARLGERLAATKGGELLVRGIPSARVQRAVLAWRRLRQEGFDGTVRALIEDAEARSAGAVHPEDVWALGAAHGLSVDLLPSASGEDRFDAVFHRAAHAVRRRRVAGGEAGAGGTQREELRPWHEYGNNPLQGRLGHVVGPALRLALSQRLPSYMVPSAFVFMDALPLTPNGKVDRRALPSPERNAAIQGKSYLPPRDALELQLVSIWESVLGVSPIGVHDNFFDLGGHSIMAVRLMAQTEKRLGRKLPLSSILDARTVEAFAQRIRASRSSTGGDTLVCIQPGAKKAPLFCVHPAGGGVLCYRELARALGPEVPVYAFEAAMGEGGRVRDRTVMDMARAYVKGVRQVQPRGPYRLSGWSLGGLVAAEMAELLRAEGETISFVGLFDTVLRPPGVKPAFVFDLARRLGFARYVETYYNRSLDLSKEELQRREGEELVAYFAERMQAAEVLPPDVDPSFVGELFGIYADHTQAYFDHEPSRFTVPMTLLRARTPLSAELVYAEMPTSARTLGWDAYCAEPVTVVDVSGDHMTLLSPGPVGELAERLRAALAEAEAQVEAKSLGHTG